MPVPASRPFGMITIGGDHSDNPANYDWRSYVKYPGLDTTQSYLRIDVIVPASPRDLKVTGLALMLGGNPLTGPTDLCYTPCPPAC